eukprot:TRINITY_DN2004_c1_g3_i1.p1 TRINITY_DN2004_c1_g3~~TRINITY_DN2004_c1_g3_i1.p1  ORF type:complete len:1008 (+),score=198.71 TRINITY_DN2004_c1_g3_i1:84-3107(+)
MRHSQGVLVLALVVGVSSVGPTRTETFTISETLRTGTESMTVGTGTESFSATLPTDTVSQTLRTPTQSESASISATLTESVSVTVSESLTVPTATGSLTLRTATMTLPTQTVSLTVGTLTATLPTSTPSFSVTVSPSLSSTKSVSSSISRSFTLSHTVSHTATFTHTSSVSLSLSGTGTFTPSFTGTPTASLSRSVSLSLTESRTTSLSSTVSMPVTLTETLTSTRSVTPSSTVSVTYSATFTPTVTFSTTLTLSGSLSPTVSFTLPTPTATFSSSLTHSLSSSATYSGTDTATLSITDTFACPAGQIDVDRVCVTKGVVAFSLRYVFATLEEATALGEDVVKEAVCKDMVASEGLLWNEVCSVGALRNGSVIADISVETSIPKAAPLGNSVAQKAAAGTLNTANMQSLFGNTVAVDKAALVDPTLDGMSLQVVVACTADNCNNRGVPSGNRPSCTCVCTDNWSGADCTTQPPTNAPATPAPLTSAPATPAPPTTNPDCAVTANSFSCGSATFAAYLACEQTRCTCLRGTVWPTINECVPPSGTSCNLILTCQDEFDACLEKTTGTFSCRQFRTRCCTDLASSRGCTETCAKDDSDDELAVLYIVLIAIGGCLCIVLLACFIWAYQKDHDPGETESGPRKDPPPQEHEMADVPPAPAPVPADPSLDKRSTLDNEEEIHHIPYGESKTAAGYPSTTAPQGDMAGDTASPGGTSYDEGAMEVDEGTTDAGTELVSPPRKGPQGRGMPLPKQIVERAAYANPQKKTEEPRSYPTKSSLKSPKADPIVVVHDAASDTDGDVVKFFDGKKNRLVTVIALDEGRACYSLEGERRPPFTYAEYRGECLRLPELQRSMILPEGKLQRVATLMELKTLFDKCFVGHNIPEEENIGSPVSMRTPSPGFPGVYDSRPGSPMEGAPLPLEWGMPPPSRRGDRVLTPLSPSAIRTPPSSVWDAQYHRNPVSYVSAGRVSPAPVHPQPDSFIHAIDSGMQALSRRSDWNPDVPRRTPSPSY